MAGHRRDRGTGRTVEARAGRRGEVRAHRLAEAPHAVARLAVAYAHLLGTLRRLAHDQALRDDTASRAERALTTIADDAWHAAVNDRKAGRR